MTSEGKALKKQRLGNSDLQITPLGFGASGPLVVRVMNMRGVRKTIKFPSKPSIARLISELTGSTQQQLMALATRKKS